MPLPALILLLAAGVSQGQAQLQEVDPLALSEEMERFLDANIDRDAAPMQRLEQLVNVVFQQNSLGFTYGTETRTSIDTFREQKGNCLSFTAMFVAMARHLDLNVNFREADIVPTWAQSGDLFIVSRHVNVSANIRGWRYVVDLFPRVDRIEIGGTVISDDRGRAHFHNNKGAEFLSLGNVQAALGEFERAVELAPKAVFAWANLGVAQARGGHLDLAEQAYLKALELDRKDLVTMMNLAELYRRTDRPEQAAHFDKQVENFRRKNPYFHFNLARQAYQEGDYEQSVRHLKSALKRKSKEHRFHWELAKAYTQLSQPEKARNCLEKARRYAPDAMGKKRYSQKLEYLAANIPPAPQR